MTRRTNRPARIPAILALAAVAASLSPLVLARAEPGKIISVATRDREVILEWEPAPGDTLTPAGRDTIGTEAFAEYKVWRSETPEPSGFSLLRKFSLYDSTWTFPGNTRGFSDPDSIQPGGNTFDPDFDPDAITGPFNGFTYYYAVTWSSASIDSSIGQGIPVFAERQGIAEGMYPEPIVPAKPAREQTPLLSQVAVVPNPYNPGARFGQSVYPGAPRVQFVNLPAACTIEIYTAAGSLVRRLEHETNRDSEPWDLKNADGRDVAPGIYVYFIQASGQESRGRFVIVR